MAPVVHYLGQVLLITFKIFFGLFFPIIFCCIILNVLSREQNRRLYYIGGWKALLVTAWIGTPIHEFSHYLFAVLSFHKVQDLKLFQPDPETGSMGYVAHSYKIDNFYQAVIGNTFIAIAPFFGGAAAIYLISSFVFPEFALFAEHVPRVYYLTIDNALEWKSYLLFGKTAFHFFNYLYDTFFSPEMLRDWKLYVFLFLMLGIANHLSPSASDFRNFWYPITALLVTIALLNLFIYPLVKEPSTIILSASKYIFAFLPILYLAIFISSLGLMITYLLSALLWLVRK
ncbi:MAG: hypothetical protein ONB31_03775 [candidate division KSB1 bacterium]|nr:hypothetical protein [candidate division KSB1 bacterium]MDZ7334520.1 hypothetical protein [candidate division KSB1 bacterium]MDZ7356967.1 hypothetical protein [candidate division KSB1 bacterium]MDZ7400971.1 hypothetical protein [candidate division KSB1 bacterium]